ncbi:hypothetical protein [uncultured Ruegeria sp.]|uniref:hypothetical protein n=1 Tax=uncultured Ruegeria sp. TaxID=259304 RepID=UPI002612417D|nr:hypothetical protein [uncultured Ruegeria sp.]
MDNTRQDGDPSSGQIPHRKTPKGGFTEGRRMQHVRKQIQCSVRQYPERPTEVLDDIDGEIEAAIREDRPIRLDHAFPHVAAHPRRKTFCSPCSELNPGANCVATETADQPEMGDRDGTEYINEYRLVVVHRMSLRGAPLGQIGALLGISSKQAQRLFDMLTDRLLWEAKHSDIAVLVGEALAFYHAVRTDCMRIAETSTDVSEQLSAIDTALAAEADKHRFLQACGFYHSARYVPQTPQATR